MISSMAPISNTFSAAKAFQAQRFLLHTHSEEQTLICGTSFSHYYSVTVSGTGRLAVIRRILEGLKSKFTSLVTP